MKKLDLLKNCLLHLGACDAGHIHGPCVTLRYFQMPIKWAFGALPPSVAAMILCLRHRLIAKSIFILSLLILSGVMQPAVSQAQQSLLDFSDGSPTRISLNVSSPAPANQSLSIKIESSSATTPNVFALEGPARLVVDLALSKTTFKSLRTGNLGIAKNNTITAVRIGSHPDKVRIVFDLAEQQKPVFSSNFANGALLISLKANNKAASTQETTSIPTTVIELKDKKPAAKPGIAQEKEATLPLVTATPTATKTPAAAKSPTPKAISTATPVATATSTPQVVASATPLPIATATATATYTATPTEQPAETETAEESSAEESAVATVAVATPTPAYVSNKQILSAIFFEESDPDKTPLIKLEMTQRPQFKMSKKDDRTYSIMINNATLGAAHLKLPQFPPQSFVGLTFVVANQVSDNVEVTIGVERGIRASAFVKDNNILLKPTVR